MRAFVLARREAAAERLALEAQLNAEWRAGAPERRKVYMATKGAQRRAALLKRIPAWVDRAAVRAVYAEARRLTLETGIPHHVDHDIPLQGKRVSGLHVAENLRVLTAAENVRKTNHYEP